MTSTLFEQLYGKDAVDNHHKVSIILPVYNGSAYIQQAIESVLKQSYSNLELIIVDDGSQDNTYDLARQIDDNRLSLIQHETNKGLPAALNTGFANADGNYLTWTSVDNLYAPDAIRYLADYLDANDECDFVYSDYYNIDESDCVNNIACVAKPTDLIIGNCIGPYFMYRRAVYEKIGSFEPALFLAEDYDYWIRVSKTFKMHAVHRPLYYNRVHK